MVCCFFILYYYLRKDYLLASLYLLSLNITVNQAMSVIILSCGKYNFNCMYEIYNI